MTGVPDGAGSTSAEVVVAALYALAARCHLLNPPAETAHVNAGLSVRAGLPLQQGAQKPVSCGAVAFRSSGPSKHFLRNS